MIRWLVPALLLVMLCGCSTASNIQANQQIQQDEEQASAKLSEEQKQAGVNMMACVDERSSYYAGGQETPENIAYAVETDCTPMIMRYVDLVTQSELRRSEQSVRLYGVSLDIGASRRSWENTLRQSVRESTISRVVRQRTQKTLE